MQLTFLTTVAALACTAVASVAPPYSGRLTSCQAQVIVDQYKSVLQNQTYNGDLPIDTASKVIAPTYQEYSDSVISLINKTLPLGGAPTTNSTEWFYGVTAHPIPTIITHDILVAGTNNVLWYWTFQGVGIGTLEIKGFNLLRIDENFQVYEADIEFNSIAWGEETFEIDQYFPAPPSSS